MSDRSKEVQQDGSVSTGPPTRATSDLTEENLKWHNEQQPTDIAGPGSASKLGPIRTVKEIPVEIEQIRSDSRNSSAREKPDVVEVEPLRSKPPLPPITGDGSGKNATKTSGRFSPVDDSVASSITSLGSQPRIMSFKREMSDEELSVNSIESQSKTANKKAASDQHPLPSLATEEVFLMKRFDGKEVTFVSIDTQTEWSWTEAMKEVEKIGTTKKERPSAEGSLSQRRDIKKASADTVRPKSQSDSVSKKDDAVEDTEPAAPFPLRDDEYGIPLLELSDIDSSDGGDESSNGDSTDKKDKKNLLPSIGPPEILKYIKESERMKQDPTVIVEEEENEENTAQEARDSDGRPLGIFAGICEFCEETIKPFPSMEQQRLYPAEQLYCCDEYRQFVNFALTNPEEAEQKVEGLIDIAPHPPYGSKTARKAAKERAVMRMREREIQRAQAAASGLAPTNFYSFARQMKTINYQLSSQKCLDEGWTIRVPSPLLEEPGDPNVFELEPVEFSHISAAAPPGGLAMDGVGKDITVTEGIVEKYYKKGGKFLTMFPNGTGTVFYPSGNIAISVMSVQKGQYTYVVQDDMSDMPDILAVFEPNGFAGCYYPNKAIRIYLDQYTGLELDVHGAKKRRWSWKDQQVHVHAPPFQPICFAINKFMSLRMMGQDNIMLTFGTKTRSCRFNVGAKLKLVNPDFIPPREIDESRLYLDETKARVHTLLNRVSNVLKFPKSPKVDKIPPPEHVTMKLKKIQKIRQSTGQTGKDVPAVIVN